MPSAVVADTDGGGSIDELFVSKDDVDEAGELVDDSGKGQRSHVSVPSLKLLETIPEIAQDAPREDSIPRVRRFNWTRDEGLTMIVYIHIGRVKVPAVVDTAAQKSIISSALRKRLNLERNGETIILHNAQAGSEMVGSELEKVPLQLGARSYPWDLIEADIGDEFILGFDFLQHYGCKVDAGRCVVEMRDGEKIFGSLQGNQGQFFHVSRVTSRNKSRIPAMSIRFVPVEFTNPSGVNYAIEPNINLPVTVLQSVVKGAEPLRVCVINCTENAVTLKRHTLLGDAIEADKIYLDSEEPELAMNLGAENADTENHCQDAQVRTVTVIESPTANIAPGSQYVRTENSVTLEDLGPDEEASLEWSTVDEDRSNDSAKSSNLDPVGELQATDHRERLPEHLWSLYEETIPNLTAAQAEELLGVLASYADVFAKNDMDVGEFNMIEHSIQTTRPGAIKQGMRRTPLGFEEAEKITLQSMKDAGVIEPSNSQWASPPVLVRKKDGSWRYCIDFRALNTVTVKDAYPLPLIDDCLDSLSGKSVFCTLDMNSGYWQIPVAAEDKDKTAFMTRYGLYQFLRLPFGLSNAPATFQRCMNTVLAGLIWETVIVYLDDINIVGKDFEETLSNLVVVLERFRKYKLKLKPRKCKLFNQEVKFLGRIAGSDGVRMTPEHIAAMQEWPTPKCRKEVEQFLGFVNYHRNYLQALAGKTALLYELTGPKAKWDWTKAHTMVFEELKQAMMQAPVLALPNARDTFVLDNDASDLAIGAELSQVQEGQERTISYASKVLHQAQRKYCTTRKELLAVVAFTRHYRHYLLGRPFIVRTDHASLVWLMRFKNPSGQLARWLEELSQYDFSIEHRSGNRHSNADGLSRIPQEGQCDCYVAGQELHTLPCGGCAFCQRVHAQWENFGEEVDYVVPLSLKHTTTIRQIGAERRSSVPNSDPTVDRQPDPSVVASVPNPVPDREVEISATSRLGDGTVDLDRLSNYMEQLKTEDLREAQVKDADIKPVLNWLQNGRSPDEGELQLQSPGTRHYWRNRSQL